MPEKLPSCSLIFSKPMAHRLSLVSFLPGSILMSRSSVHSREDTASSTTIGRNWVAQVFFFVYLFTNSGLINSRHQLASDSESAAWIPVSFYNAGLLRIYFLSFSYRLFCSPLLWQNWEYQILMDPVFQYLNWCDFSVTMMKNDIYLLI